MSIETKSGFAGERFAATVRNLVSAIRESILLMSEISGEIEYF